jgi:hypothetical protein
MDELPEDVIERLRHHSQHADDEYYHEVFGRAADEIERLRNMLAIADNIIETVALPSSNKGVGDFYDRFYTWLDKARAVQKRIAALQTKV